MRETLMWIGTGAAVLALLFFWLSERAATHRDHLDRTPTEQWSEDDLEWTRQIGRENTIGGYDSTYRRCRMVMAFLITVVIICLFGSQW